MTLDRPIRTVLFDAGGVLLDLDFSYVRRLVEARRVEVDVEALAREEALARTEVHQRVLAGEKPIDLWREYFHYILGRVGVPAEHHAGIINSLWEAHARFGLWRVPIAGAIDTVRELGSRGFRIGVVSNAEGRVERDLHDAGYDGLFATVVDSHVVGVAKPDPAIFAIALERLGADAETTLYVGDVPSIDVAGARSAGILPILLDNHRVYPDERDVLRMESITELLAVLDRPPAS